MPTSNFQWRSDLGTENLRQFVTGNIINGSGYDNEIDRVTYYYLYWNFYKGYHWRTNNHQFMQFNYVRAFVDKPAQFLVGKKSFSLQVSSYSTDTIPKDLEEAAEKELLKHWNRNKRPTTTYEMLQMGGITGDCWMFVGWNKEKNHGIVKVLDSRYSFPEFAKGDYNDMESFEIRQPLRANKDGFITKVTKYTKTETTTWFQRTSAKTEDKSEKTVQVHNLGFIPIVHIKNKPTSDGYFGQSDVVDILSLNKTYNELAHEIKSIIDYYVAPTTIVTGATLSNIKKKLGTVWSGLPPEANVFNLGLDADLSAAQQFMELIKTSMHEMSDVPENFLGKIQSISGTSAAALQLTFQPIIQKVDLKWLTYGQGIAEINSVLVQYIRIFDPTNKNLRIMDAASSTGKFEDDFKVEPIFPYGFPQDRQNEIQLAQQELDMKVTSRRRVMDRLGTNNIPELMKEIEEDALELATLQGKVTLLSEPAPPTEEDAPPQDEEPPMEDIKVETSPEDFLGESAEDEEPLIKKEQNIEE